ncbi:hypothetical protein PFISCL1PPCAC_12936, partial [Pristionchus fissidentatus]
IWSNRFVCLLILLQFVAPTFASIFYILPSFSALSTNGERVFLAVDNRALIVLKYVNTSLYFFYCIACFVLTFLSSRQLSAMGRHIEVLNRGNTRRRILRQQRKMFTIVTVCCVTQLLKAAQQVNIILFKNIITKSKRAWSHISHL